MHKWMKIIFVGLISFGLTSFVSINKIEAKETKKAAKKPVKEKAKPEAEESESDSDSNSEADAPKEPAKTKGSTKSKSAANLSGKVFLTDEEVKGLSPDALSRLFDKQVPKGTIQHDDAGRWKSNLVAFFKKEAIPGPITIWIYDKADKESIKAKEPIHAISVEAPPKTIFVYPLEIDPDLGLSKGRPYLVMIGQIIKKQEKIYAVGEMVLQK